MKKSQNSGETTEGKKTSKEEDLEVIAQCLEGDWEAFEVLFQKYRDRVYHIVYRYVHNKEDALDIVQEVFAKVYTSLDKFQGRSAFYTWLCRIAINKAIDHTRVKKNTLSYEPFMTHDEQEGPQVPQTIKPHRGMEGEEFQKTFRQAIDDLPEIHKSVFVLYALEDLSYKEIAQVLDCSLGTVMSRLHYARKKLQSMLRDYQVKKKSKKKSSKQ